MSEVSEAEALPMFAVERTFWEPVFQHLALAAPDAETAMNLAMKFESWDSAKTAYEDCRGTHITGCWHGAETYCGEPIAIPSHLQASPSDAPGPVIHDQLFKEAPALAELVRKLVQTWDENMGPDPFPELATAGAPRNQLIEQARAILGRIDAHRERLATPPTTE